MSSPYPAQGDGDKDGPTPGLGKSSPRPALVAYEKGDTVVDVESLLRSCSANGLSAKLTDRIREADVDRDGVLSVDELVEVMRREMQAVSDRKLFRNILIALFVAVLVLIATLCGTVYAIVDLSKEVKNDNGVLVSSSSGDVMATGTAQQTVTVGPELLSLLEFPESLINAQSVIIPTTAGGKATTLVYKVAKITSSPEMGSMEVLTLDGTTLLTNQSGMYEQSGGGEYLPVFELVESRRRLLIDSVGMPETQGAPSVVVQASSGTGVLPGYSPLSTECFSCIQNCRNKYNRDRSLDWSEYVDCMDRCKTDYCY
ncbi:hypothetical protein PSENEW3_00003208 [Picochlorum sp. SENEW3]|nr:hypothetical protein PSENEW3_00003208 [Picochlorum sp. SENEW3]